jgi:hypothetical protein
MKDVLDIRAGRDVELRFITAAALRFSYTVPADELIGYAKELFQTGSTGIEVCRTGRGYSASAYNMIYVTAGQTIAAKFELPNGETADLTVKADDLLDVLQKLMANGSVSAKFSRGADGRLTASVDERTRAAPTPLSVVR